IKAILRRMSNTSESFPAISRIGNKVINSDRYEVELDGEVLSFTRKEFKILSYLENYREKVLTRAHLLREVWNYSFSGDTRIVDVHISRLREKIEPNTKKPQYIKTIRGLGYKIEDPTT